MEKKQDENKKEGYFRHYLIIFIALLIIGIFYPLTGDDWNRMEEVRYSFSFIFDRVYDQWQNLNGRVLGNIISFIFIKPAFLRSLVKALTFCLMIKCVQRLFSFKSPLYIYLSFILFWLSSLGVFRQVWVWSAGFYNYVPPILIFLYILCLMKDRVEEPDKKELNPTLSLLLGIVGCLFMENLTIFFVLFTGFFLVYIRVKEKRLDKMALCLFLGSIIGAGIMFSSPVYWKVLTGEDTYRTIGQGQGIFSTIVKNWRRFSEYMIRWEVCHTVLIAIFVSLNLRDYKKNPRSTNIMALVFIGLSLYFLLSPPYDGEGQGNLFFAIDLGLHLAYYLLLLVLGKRILSEERDRKLWSTLIWSMPFSMGSLLVVTPLGARNFITSSSLSALYSLMLIREYFRKEEGREYLKDFKKLVYRGAIIAYAVYAFFLVSNGICFFERINILERTIEEGGTSCQIRRYPYDAFVATDSPGKMSKYYYREKPYDIEVSYLDE